MGNGSRESDANASGQYDDREPIAAGLLATQLVGEPITLNLIIGLIAVFAGIWIATTETKKP